MKIGAHVSAAGGLGNSIRNALKIEADTFQIFTQNQRRWQNPPLTKQSITEFKRLRAAHFSESVVASHASYLINLCSDDTTILNKSRKLLKDELTRCQALGIDYLVIHPGSFPGEDKEEGMNRIVESLLEAWFENCQVEILLETTAGQGNSIGHSFEQLSFILKKIRPEIAAGICLDTCHVFAAGYDFRTGEGLEAVLREFHKKIGFEALKFLHLNDSKTDCGSRVDRHARIGEGRIGLKGFAGLLKDDRIPNVPGILEIPGDQDAFRADIKRIRKIIS